MFHNLLMKIEEDKTNVGPNLKYKDKSVFMSMKKSDVAGTVWPVCYCGFQSWAHTSISKSDFIQNSANEKYQEMLSSRSPVIYRWISNSIWFIAKLLLLLHYSMWHHLFLPMTQAQTKTAQNVSSEITITVLRK